MCVKEDLCVCESSVEDHLIMKLLNVKAAISHKWVTTVQKEAANTPLCLLEYSGGIQTSLLSEMLTANTHMGWSVCGTR